jgi:hypothetical protein
VLELDGAQLDVLTDRRIPHAPPRRHRTPQQVAEDPASALRIDTLVVRGATITYRERKPGTEQPGRATFEAVRGPGDVSALFPRAACRSGSKPKPG